MRLPVTPPKETTEAKYSFALTEPLATLAASPIALHVFFPFIGNPGVREDENVVHGVGGPYQAVRHR